LFGLSTFGYLRTLALDNVYHGIGLDALVARSQPTQLRELRLRSWRPEEGLAFPDIGRALAHGGSLPYLVHLELSSREGSHAGDGNADALCAVIARSGILGQLRVLVLGLDDITDMGAHALASSPELRRLERVELRAARLTEVGRQVLRAAGARLLTPS
jgi:hypothetical protein